MADSPRVWHTVELLDILSATPTEESPREWLKGYLEHLVDQGEPGAEAAWDRLRNARWQ